MDDTSFKGEEMNAIVVGCSHNGLGWMRRHTLPLQVKAGRGLLQARDQCSSRISFRANSGSGLEEVASYPYRAERGLGLPARLREARAGPDALVGNAGNDMLVRGAGVSPPDAHTQHYEVSVARTTTMSA